MKKRIWRPICIAGALFACTLVMWLLLIENFAPHISHSYDVDIGVEGDVYLLPDVETELREIVGKLEKKTENVELIGVKYQLYADGTGKACFSYRFDTPKTAYSRLLEPLTSQNSVGILELWISLPDTAVYHVNYNYGNIKGISEAPKPLEKADADILYDYKNLMIDTEYLASVGEQPNFIEIERKPHNISAKAYSMDGEKVLYTF